MQGITAYCPLGSDQNSSDQVFIDARERKKDAC